MNVKTLFLTCAAALSLLLFSCDNQIGKKPAPKPAPQTKTNTVKKPAAQPQAAKPAQPQPPKPAQQAQKPSMMDDVYSVSNYGTCATAIQAKKRMTDKLNKAQGQHNKQLDDALK